MTAAARPSACAGCGGPASDAHHLARRANDPDLTAPFCQPCHRQLTRWHREEGVPGGSNWTPSALDRARAIYVGFADVAALVNINYGRSRQVESRDIARVFSELLAVIGGEARRWVPDHGSALTATESAAPPEVDFDEAAWAVALAQMLVDVSRTLFGDADLLTAFCVALAALTKSGEETL